MIVPDFVVVEMKYNEAFRASFSENTRKKLNLVFVVVLVLESKDL